MAPDDSDDARERRSQLGARITEQRQKKGLSLSALARRAVVPKSHLHGIEAGEHQPGVFVAARLASELDTTVDALLGGDA